MRSVRFNLSTPRLDSLAFAAAAVRTIYRDSPSAYRIRQLLRWPLLAFWHGREFLQWRTQCRRAPLADHLPHQPFLILKPLRPYLSCTWDCSRRMKVLADTYAALDRGPPELRQIFAAEGLTVARLRLRSGGVLTLHAGTAWRFRKEGEIVLSAQYPDEFSGVASLTLALEYSPGGTVAYIGTLQGAADSRELHSRLTKELYGLRPAALLVFVAQILARTLSVSRLYAVAQDAHVHRTKRLIYLGKPHALHRNYDRLWESLGAVRRGGGPWFEFPLQLKPRTPAEQPRRKRALYAHRYTLLARLQVRIEENLGATSRLPALENADA